MIGEDGKFLLDFLKNSGVNIDNVLIRNDIRSGNAIIQRDSFGDNCIILFAGANRSIIREYVDKVLEKFERGDYIVLQNEISELPYIVETAHKIGMKIVLNPSPMDEKIEELNLTYIDYFLLNEMEALKLSGIDECDGKKCMDELVDKYKQAGVLITLGDKGAIYSDGDIFVEQGVVKTEVVDTTAAGDTFTGYFVNGILEGEEMKEVLRVAATASSIAVSRIGAAPSIPAMNEVKERLKNL